MTCCALGTFYNGTSCVNITNTSNCAKADNNTGVCTTCLDTHYYFNDVGIILCLAFTLYNPVSAGDDPNCVYDNDLAADSC